MDREQGIKLMQDLLRRMVERNKIEDALLMALNRHDPSILGPV